MNANGRESGLRERKRRETRAALSHATIRLCILRGWDKVTVDDVAAAANVSPRTFRNYFSTKAEAIAAGHLERMLRIADELRGRPVDEALWTAITQSVIVHFEVPVEKGAGRWAERVRFLLTEPAIYGEVLKATAAAQVELAKAIAERCGTEGLYPELMAGVVMAAVGVVGERWMREGPTGSMVPALLEALERVKPASLEPGALQSVLMFQGIEHLAISSPNPEKLAHWYVDHLEFHINYTYAGNYFVRATNGAVIEIIPADKSLSAPQVIANNKDAGFRHLAIACDDFDAGVAGLRAKGVQMVGEPFETQGNRLAFFNDADGNLVHLIKREKPLP